MSSSTATEDVLSTTKLLEQTQLHDQTNAQAGSPVATMSACPSTNAVISISDLLDQTNAQAESPVATTSTTPATDAVLSTTELLEQILSHFDIKELVLLRRVSRNWTDVMAESLVLQRIMYLAPESELPFEWHLKHGAYEEPYLYTKVQSGTVSEFGPDDEVFTSCRFNPLLFERRPNADTSNTDETNHAFRSHRFYPRHPLKDVGASKLFSRMLIAQPPFDYAFVGCNTTISNIDGIRVKNMVLPPLSPCQIQMFNNASSITEMSNVWISVRQ